MYFHRICERAFYCVIKLASMGFERIHSYNQIKKVGSNSLTKNNMPINLMFVCEFNMFIHEIMDVAKCTNLIEQKKTLYIEAT